VQQGDLYRLFSPREGEFTANQYVSRDGNEAVLFAFLHSSNTCGRRRSYICAAWMSAPYTG